MAIIIVFYYCFCPGTGIFSQHLQLVCAPSSAALIPSLFTRHPGGDVKSEAPRPYLAQVWGVTADVWNHWSFSPILPYHCWVQLIHVVQSHKTWLWSWQCWSSLRCWPSRSSLCTKMCLLFFLMASASLWEGKGARREYNYIDCHSVTPPAWFVWIKLSKPQTSRHQYFMGSLTFKLSLPLWSFHALSFFSFLFSFSSFFSSVNRSKDPEGDPERGKA